MTNEPLPPPPTADLKDSTGSIAYTFDMDAAALLASLEQRIPAAARDQTLDGSAPFEEGFTPETLRVVLDMQNFNPVLDVRWALVSGVLPDGQRASFVFDNTTEDEDRETHAARAQQNLSLGRRKTYKQAPAWVRYGVSLVYKQASSELVGTAKRHSPWPL